MLDQLLSPQVIERLQNEITQVVRESLQSSNKKDKEKSKRNIVGYLNQTKAQKYVGSKALLAKLEANGLGRFEIDGTIRYKIADLDEFMEIFRC